MKEKQVGLDALAKYKAELAELQLSFSAMRKELEMANLAKANLETEMASFQRDSETSKTMYDAELKELRMKTEFEMSEMDDSALIESDARLEKSLHDLRRYRLQWQLLRKMRLAKCSKCYYLRRKKRSSFRNSINSERVLLLNE